MRKLVFQYKGKSINSCAGKVMKHLKSLFDIDVTMIFFNCNYSKTVNSFFRRKKSRAMIRPGFSAFKGPGQPVSRILSGGRPTWMDIYLG
jgi:hypothetical protein